MNLYPRLRLGWRTKSVQFKSEEAFCNWVARALDKWGYRYEREKFCALTESRLDFSVQEAGVNLEAKVDVSWTCFDRAIGQIVRYSKLEQMSVPWILVPDDVFLGYDRVELAQAVQSRIVPLSKLEENLHFQRVHNLDLSAQFTSPEFASRQARSVILKRNILAKYPTMAYWEGGSVDQYDVDRFEEELKRRAA